jgi:hypothetical protein
VALRPNIYASLETDRDESDRQQVCAGKIHDFRARGGIRRNRPINGFLQPSPDYYDGYLSGSRSGQAKKSYHAKIMER